jgi:hypothetical protein
MQIMDHRDGQFTNHEEDKCMSLPLKFQCSSIQQRFHLLYFTVVQMDSKYRNDKVSFSN